MYGCVVFDVRCILVGFCRECGKKLGVMIVKILN